MKILNIHNVRDISQTLSSAQQKATKATDTESALQRLPLSGCRHHNTLVADRQR